MIVVDSSAFIEYYRPSGSSDVQTAVEAAIAADEVAVNGIIQVEIVAFAATQADRRQLEADFDAFHWLDLGRRDFDLAAELGFALRRRGVTIPATDLIIAASAIRAEARLYHLDAHYDLVAQHSELEARSFLPRRDAD